MGVSRSSRTRGQRHRGRNRSCVGAVVVERSELVLPTSWESSGPERWRWAVGTGYGPRARRRVGQRAT